MSLTLSTPRLTLRPLEAADALTLHRFYQSEGMLRYFLNPNPPPKRGIDHSWRK